MIHTDENFPYVFYIFNRFTDKAFQKYNNII